MEKITVKKAKICYLIDVKDKEYYRKILKEISDKADWYIDMIIDNLFSSMWMYNIYQIKKLPNGVKIIDSYPYELVENLKLLKIKHSEKIIYKFRMKVSDFEYHSLDDECKIIV